jgi:hypothetical protein
MFVQCTCVYTHVHIYIYTYIYIHTYMYMFKHKCADIGATFVVFSLNTPARPCTNLRYPIPELPCRSRQQLVLPSTNYSNCMCFSLIGSDTCGHCATTQSALLRLSSLSSERSSSAGLASLASCASTSPGP